MNFLDAVKELSEGRCKGIKRQGWDKNSILKLGYGSVQEITFNDGGTWIPCLVDFTSDDYLLVDPTPQTEEVIIERWAKLEDGVWMGSTSSLEQAENWCHSTNREIVKLTGTITRTIKPKAKRRQEIDAHEYISIQNRFPAGVRIFAEWEETAQ